MTFEAYIKAIETLGTLEAEISEAKEKIYELETEEAAISAVSGDANPEKDQKKLQLIEATLKIVDCEETKSSLNKEAETIKARIKDFERLGVISSEKDELDKKLKQLLKKYSTANKKYEAEKKAFEEGRAKFGVEICGKVVAKEEKEPETVPEVEEVVEETTSITSYPDEIVPVVETSEEESTNVDATHSLQAVVNVMGRYDCKYKFNADSEENENYSIAYAGIWDEISISEDEKKLIDKICDEVEIPGMSSAQVKKLKLSLPTELLIKIGREDIVKERSAETKAYNEKKRNRWRGKFTYAIISQLWEMVREKISSSDDKRDDIEADIDEFMLKNTDHLKSKGKGIFKLNEEVVEAFCIVEE